MKLLRSMNPHVNFLQGTVATIGNFDGIHLGHQKLIKTLKSEAVRLNMPLVVILFEPQPLEYFKKSEAPSRLSSLREKLDGLKSCGVDYVYCIKFDASFAETDATRFVNHYLFDTLNVRYLMVGADFQFGKGRAGNFELLVQMGEQHGCKVAVCPDLRLNDEKVSSTKVRQALVKGELELAASYLGRTYSLCGRVIHGDGRGRQWGIPTANLTLHKRSLALTGVYVVQVKIDSKEFHGVANIGNRPTVDGLKQFIEVHLFDFDQMIYGKLMHVAFLKKLRNEEKFPSVELLIAQIHQDISLAKSYFSKTE